VTKILNLLLPLNFMQDNIDFIWITLYVYKYPNSCHPHWWFFYLSITLHLPRKQLYDMVKNLHAEGEMMLLSMLIFFHGSMVRSQTHIVSCARGHVVFLASLSKVFFYHDWAKFLAIQIALIFVATCAHFYMDNITRTR
jgi:hypothetical protein